MTRVEPRTAALALALLLHALLLWVFVAQPGVRRAAPRPELVFLQLWPAPAVTEAAPRARTAPPANRPRAAPDRPPPPAVRHAATPPRPAPPDAPVEPTPMLARSAPPEPPASAASAPQLRLLDNAATRRAIREAAGTPSIGERGALVTQAPPLERPGERLAHGIERAATGDCLKGQYAGGGMGLLSLPFWLAAEARGKCRR